MPFQKKGNGGDAAKMHYKSAAIEIKAAKEMERSRKSAEIEVKEAREMESFWNGDHEQDLAAFRRYGAKKMGAAQVPILEKHVSYFGDTAETVLPSKGFAHKQVSDVGALAMRGEVSYSRTVEAVMPSSHIGVSLCKGTLTAAPTCHLESEDVAVGKEAVAPAILNKVVASCKSNETVAPIVGKGVYFSNIKEARTPISEKGAPTSKKGAVYCSSRGFVLPMQKQEPYLETAACRDFGNGVSLSNSREASGSTLEKEALVNDITETAALSRAGAGTLCKAAVEAGLTSGKEVSSNVVPATAAPTSDNGVFSYEMGFPDVLCPPSSCKHTNDDFLAPLHVYGIQYSVLQKGQESINRVPPTQFVLLNYFPIDDEVAHHFSVRLNLPHQECVSAHLIPFDMICLTSDQMNIMEVFNGLLFSFMLGNNSVDLDNFDTADIKMKGYSLMPLKNDGFDLKSEGKVASGLIDWTMALDLVQSKLNIKKWSQYHATPNPDIKDWLSKGNEATAKGWLRLKSGFYKEQDLIDAFVTYGPWNLRCFITGISKELSGLSLMQEKDCCPTYKDYWFKRFGVELKHVSQPLLVVYSLSRASNFCLRPSQEALWCNAKAKKILVPPEVCILQTGLKGNLWRGSVRLPSILCSLENALLAAQLRDRIGPHISVFKVQEALTSGAYNVYQSYERLELVGDSLLTLVAATALYIKDSLMNKQDLASALHSLVENKHLFQCAETCGLASYVFNEPFHVKQWIPPGRVPICLNVNGKKFQVGIPRKQRISWRTLADVVEAVVGAYAMEGSLADVLKAMSWLGVKIDYPQAAAWTLPSRSVAAEVSLIPRCLIANLENALMYSFKNHGLLATGLCYHVSEDDGGLQFSRLAYLGDCILSHLVTRHLITVHQSLDVGIINEMKQSIINKENLACVAVRSKLHSFMTDTTPAHRESIVAYALKLEEESSSDKALPAYGFIGLCAPKGLGELISAIAAAIYLDCELDSELVWKILQPFLEPLPMPGSFALHPINELTQYCKARCLLLDVHTTCHAGVYEAHVIVNKECIASSAHEEKRYARKYAAVQALHQLKVKEM